MPLSASARMLLNKVPVVGAFMKAKQDTKDSNQKAYEANMDIQTIRSARTVPKQKFTAPSYKGARFVK